MKHVFIVGSKGIPANYSGFETFVQELVLRKKSEEIVYHVACSDFYRGGPDKPTRDVTWNGVHCFYVPVRDIGSARAVIYDLMALQYCVSYIQEHSITGAIVYILCSRIGPFVGYFRAKLKAWNTVLMLNPDGFDWKRQKWSMPIRCYWKLSGQWMIANMDRVVCDSKAIRDYVENEYRVRQLETYFIPYGACYVGDSDKTSELLITAGEDARNWLLGMGVEPGQYYLVVARFVPENNFECILREFMRSNTRKKLLLIADNEGTKLYTKLKKRIGFDKDDRICFAGTLFDRRILTVVRMMAFAYIHGHSVGGTNPSLLESMGTTNVNLLFDVQFNREVGKDTALYWTKEAGNLAKAIQMTETMTEEQRDELGAKAKARIHEHYSWDHIVTMYESLFLKEL